jgi:hypothetical protein
MLVKTIRLIITSGLERLGRYKEATFETEDNRNCISIVAIHCRVTERCRMQFKVSFCSDMRAYHNSRANKARGSQSNGQSTSRLESGIYAFY